MRLWVSEVRLTEMCHLLTLLLPSRLSHTQPAASLTLRASELYQPRVWSTRVLGRQG